MKSYLQRGLFSIALAIMVALFVYMGTDAWLRMIASSGSNPDQNAMLIAWLINVASLVVSAGILGYGLDCMVKAYRQSKQSQGDK